jgi:hypothetical protein
VLGLLDIALASRQHIFQILLFGINPFSIPKYSRIFVSAFFGRIELAKIGVIDLQKKSNKILDKFGRITYIKDL